MKKWMVAVLAVLVVLAVVGCSSTAKNTPTGAVQNGLQALKELNEANMAKYFIGDDFSLSDLSDQDAAMVNLVKALLAKGAVSVTDEEVAEGTDTATVTADVTGVDLQQLALGSQEDLFEIMMSGKSQEEMVSDVVTLFGEKAASAETKTTAGVEIRCEKDGEDWKISDPDTLMGALLGGGDLSDLF